MKRNETGWQFIAIFLIMINKWYWRMPEVPPTDVFPTKSSPSKFSLIIRKLAVWSSNLAYSVIEISSKDVFLTQNSVWEKMCVGGRLIWEGLWGKSLIIIIGVGSWVSKQYTDNIIRLRYRMFMTTKAAGKHWITRK